MPDSTEISLERIADSLDDIAKLLADATRRERLAADEETSDYGRCGTVEDGY